MTEIIETRCAIFQSFRIRQDVSSIPSSTTYVQGRIQVRRWSAEPLEECDMPKTTTQQSCAGVGASGSVRSSSKNGPTPGTRDARVRASRSALELANFLSFP